MAKSCLLFPLLTLLNLPDIDSFRNSRMSFFLFFFDPVSQTQAGSPLLHLFKFCHSQGLCSSSSPLLSPWHMFMAFQALILTEASVLQCSSSPNFSAMELTDIKRTYFSSPHPKVVSPPIFPCPISSAQWITVCLSGPGDADPR